jgi:hypothetical protein
MQKKNKIEHETRFLRGKPLREKNHGRRLAIFTWKTLAGKKPRAPIGDLHYDKRVTTQGIQ